MATFPPVILDAGKPKQANDGQDIEFSGHIWPEDSNGTLGTASKPWYAVYIRNVAGSETVELKAVGSSNITSGAACIGVYATELDHSASSSLQDVLDDLDNAITTAPNTLDEAYDEGGAGAGYLITADANPVNITVPDNEGGSMCLELHQNDVTNNPGVLAVDNQGDGDAVLIENEGSGAAIEIGGTGSRVINSTSASITVSTATSGDVILDSAGNIDIDGTAIFLDGTSASAFTVTGSNLTLETVTTGAIFLVGVQGVDIRADNGSVVLGQVGLASNISINTNGGLSCSSVVNQDLSFSTTGTGVISFDSIKDIDIDADENIWINVIADDASARKIVISAANAGAGSGSVDIDADGSVTIDSSAGSISIAAAGASDFTTSSGDLTLEATTGDVIVKLGDALGAKILSVVDSGSSPLVAITSDGEVQTSDGTSTTPAFAFLGETNSGWRREGAGDVRLTILGGDEITVTATSTTFGGQLLTPSGAQGNPPHSFSTDSDTGMFVIPEDNLRFSCGGATRASLQNIGDGFIRANTGNMEVGTLISGDVHLHSIDDIVAELGDQAGVHKFIVKDSAANAVLEISSDGNIDVGGSSYFSCLDGNLTISTTTGAGSVLGNLIFDSINEITFDDVNRNASTYGIDLKLSDASTEWDDFEAEFGEVSLINAVVQSNQQSIPEILAQFNGLQWGYILPQDNETDMDGVGIYGGAVNTDNSSATSHSATGYYFVSKTSGAINTRAYVQSTSAIASTGIGPHRFAFNPVIRARFKLSSVGDVRLFIGLTYEDATVPIATADPVNDRVGLSFDDSRSGGTETTFQWTSKQNGGSENLQDSGVTATTGTFEILIICDDTAREAHYYLFDGSGTQLDYTSETTTGNLPGSSRRMQLWAGIEALAATIKEIHLFGLAGTNNF